MESWLTGFLLVLGILLLADIGKKLSSLESTAVHVHSLLGLVVAIFIAITWFQAFDEVAAVWLDFSTIGCLVHAFFFYAMALTITWQFRERKTELEVISESCAHFVSFATMKAAHHMQEEHLSDNPVYAASAAVVVAIACNIIANLKDIIVATCKLDHVEWNEEVVHLGMDVAGMTLAFVLSQAVQFAICGEFHSIEDRSQIGHTGLHLTIALLYAENLTFVCAFLINMSTIHIRQYRVAGVIRHTLGMMTTWSYVFVLQWGIIELSALQHLSEMVRGIVAAIICTSVVFTVLWVVCALQPNDSSAESWVEVLLHGLALLCAWSWEWCFDLGIEEFTHESTERAVLKMLLAIISTVIILPLYVTLRRTKAPEPKGHKASHIAEQETSTESDNLELQGNNEAETSFALADTTKATTDVRRRMPQRVETPRINTHKPGDAS